MLKVRNTINVYSQGMVLSESHVKEDDVATKNNAVSAYSIRKALIILRGGESCKV